MADRVLIVDDEAEICNVIAMFLVADGVKTLKAHTGGEALDLFSKEKVDLVILDIMLPDMNGIEVCRAIRAMSDVPILFLSALADDDYYILGYRAGADDYIAKPFSMAILALKVRRMLEVRAQSAAKAAIEAVERGAERAKNGEDAHNADACSVTLDEEAYDCRVGGESIHLTQKEFMLIAALINARGKVLTREKLLSMVWGYDFMGGTRVVDTHIKKLRHKLGAAADNIVTVVSVGYKYEER